MAKIFILCLQKLYKYVNEIIRSMYLEGARFIWEKILSKKIRTMSHIKNYLVMYYIKKGATLGHSIALNLYTGTKRSEIRL